MSSSTSQQYLSVIHDCKEVFRIKTKDYGTSWRIFRTPSITDQIYIKAKRIRSIQEKKVQKVDDTPLEEWMGIVNYCIIGQIQAKLTNFTPPDNKPEELEKNTHLSWENVAPMYEQAVRDTMELQLKKNHDYDEAWRSLRISSIIDLILVKILRIKHIEDNQGETIISEGILSQYKDIMNYAIFSLILSKEKDEQK